MEPVTNSDTALVTLNEGAKINRVEFHKRLRHCGNDLKLSTTKMLKLTGPPEKCESCATAKARQKNLKKVTENICETPGERLHIDQSTVKHNSLGGRKNWLLVVDEATNFKWSYFLRKKSDQVEVLTGLIKKLKNNGKKVKMIRCDNAGENKALEKECKDKD